MKLNSLLVLLCILSGALSVFAQGLYVEPEKQNDMFVKSFKGVELMDVFNVSENRLLGVYEDVSRSGLQKGVVFRLMDHKLKQIKSRVHDLPEDYYLRYTHQFDDGTILAVFFEDLPGSKVELFMTTVSLDRLQLDLKRKVSLGTFELTGRRKRQAIKSGNLFTIVRQRGSGHIAIVSNATNRRSDDASYDYTIIDKNMKVTKQASYDFGIKRRDLNVQNFTVSALGHLYCTYGTYVDDNRAGDNTYILQMDTGKKHPLAGEDQFLSDPSLVAQDGKVFFFSTYTDERRNKIRGRSSGIFFATLDESNVSLQKKSTQPYPEKVLEDYFVSRTARVKKDEIVNPLQLIFLRAVGDDNYAFMMEDRMVRRVTNRDGTVTLIYSSGSAICGVIDQSTSSFKWIGVVPKVEITRNVNRVGSFAYLNDHDELCVLFNSTKKREKKDGVELFVNRNIKNTSLVQLRFDQTGKAHEDVLIDREDRKDIGFIFDSSRAFQDLNSDEVYLVLTKRVRNLLRIAKID